MTNYPNTPGSRRGAPETSQDAAAEVAEAAVTRASLALGFIREQAFNGGTADEVAHALGWERYSSRPRLAELHKRGAIVDSGRRRLGASGRSQAVWVVPEYGPNQPDDPQASLFDLAA